MGAVWALHPERPHGEAHDVRRSLRRASIRGRLEQPARLTVETYRHGAGERHPPQMATLFAEIRYRPMLRRTVVPDRDIARLPPPAHRVLRSRDVILEDREQPLRVRAPQTDEALDEMACEERPLSRLGMHAHDRMLGLIHGRCEYLAV